MRRLLINLNDEQDAWLSAQVNQNEVVRAALDIYREKVSPDTIQGLRKSYKQLYNFMDSKFQYYDQVFAQLEKLINMLETRM